MPEKKNKIKKIPPPPGVNVSWEKQAAYFEKYSRDDLEQAGYLEPMNKSDIAFAKQVQAAARERVAKLKERPQLNISFQEEQLLSFLTVAKQKHLPPSTLAKSWILERLDQERKTMPKTS